jgi:hypothetical protein
MKTSNSNTGPGNGEGHSSNGVNINSAGHGADTGGAGRQEFRSKSEDPLSGKVVELAAGEGQKPGFGEGHDEHVKQFVKRMADELLAAVTNRVAMIRAELFQFLLKQPLAFFVVAYAQSKLGYARKKGSLSNVKSVASHLRIL